MVVPANCRLMQQSRCTSRGIALVTVLWLVVLLTLLGTAVSTVSLSQRRMVQRYAESIADETAADSAIRLLLLKLFDGSADSRPAVGTQSIVLQDKAIHVSLSRESGRVDLNTASTALLYAFFAANGYSEQEADQLAARIEDWRDSDSAPLPNGAELDNYRQRGLSYTPRDARFESVEELRQVLDAENIDSALLESLTVYSRAESPSVAAATPSVLNALAWAERHDLENRHWLDDTGSDSDTNEISTPTDPGIQASEVVRIRACVTTRITELCRVAIVRLTGSKTTPYQVLVWKTDV